MQKKKVIILGIKNETWNFPLINIEGKMFTFMMAIYVARGQPNTHTNLFDVTFRFNLNSMHLDVWHNYEYALYFLPSIPLCRNDRQLSDSRTK